jgi:hypothetical protein
MEHKAAVGVAHHIFGEQRLEPGQVSRPRGVEERCEKSVLLSVLLRARHRSTPFARHVPACTAHQLTRVGLAAAEDARNLVVGVREGLAQHVVGALRWSETLQKEEHDELDGLVALCDEICVERGVEGSGNHGPT